MDWAAFFPFAQWFLKPRPLPACGLIAAWFFAFMALRCAFWRFSMATLPGTIAHELCHFVVGKLTFARPVHFTVIPHRVERSWVFGSVRFAGLNLMNSAPTGLAPLMLLPVGALLFDYWVTPLCQEGQWLIAVLASWVVASCWHSCWPSVQDWRVAGWSTVIYAIILYVCWSYGFHLGPSLAHGLRFGDWVMGWQPGHLAALLAI